MVFSYSLFKKIVSKIPPRPQLLELLNFRIFEAEGEGKNNLEISIPANRYSDAVSHFGLARLISAATGAKLIDLVLASAKSRSESDKFQIKISSKKQCSRYSGLYAEFSNLKSSPQWLKDVLADCGLRSINSVVDVMNYVMLEIGQPLHAFDADLISGAIDVRLAKNGEKITTLDGAELKLTNQDLLIADDKRPLAIAGIKGGKTAEVNTQTKRIIVEAANFDGASIYRTARRLNLFTDAGTRFAHGLSPYLVERGIRRAAQLLKEICGAKIGDWVDVDYSKLDKTVLKFDVKKFNALTGFNLEEKVCLEYLKRLGFEIKGDLVTAPPERMDIESFEDLAEEIVNLHSYDELPAIAPKMILKPSGQEDSVVLKSKSRKLLAGLGLNEVYNYSFVAGLKDQNFIWYSNNAKLVELENPIVEDKKYLRPSLLLGLLKNVEDNWRFNDEVRIFEIGRVFAEEKGGLSEKLMLGLALGLKKQRPFLELKGSLDSFFSGVGLLEHDFVPVGDNLRIESDHHVLGYVRAAQADIAVAEIDLTKLVSLIQEEKEYRPLSKYPSIVRDLSFIVDAETRVGDIQNILENISKLVEDVDLVDWFQDEQKLGTDKKSLTFRLVFQSEERTLTDEEVGKEMERVVSALEKKFDIEVR